MSAEEKGLEIRVLVVEDEDGLRVALKRFFESRGCTVFVASEGVTAIKVLLDETVDAIVSDYKMDILGGDYWVRFLQKHYSDKKVVIITGFLGSDVKLPFPVLKKPFSFEVLEHLVAS